MTTTKTFYELAHKKRNWLSIRFSSRRTHTQQQKYEKYSMPSKRCCHLEGRILPPLFFIPCELQVNNSSFYWHPEMWYCWEVHSQQNSQQQRRWQNPTQAKQTPPHLAGELLGDLVPGWHQVLPQAVHHSGEDAQQGAHFHCELLGAGQLLTAKHLACSAGCQVLRE